MDGLIMTVRIQASANARPDVDDDTTFILLTVDQDSDPDATDGPSIGFDITTNAGIMSLPDGATQLGSILHQVSHALIAGAKIDLTVPAGEVQS